MQGSALVVDDNRDDAATLMGMLDSMGLNTILEERRVEALCALRDESPVVVLIELYLEDSDGIELLITVRRRHPEVPVVAFSSPERTAYAQVAGIARHLGAIAVLEKPIARVDLMRVLTEALAA